MRLAFTGHRPQGLKNLSQDRIFDALLTLVQDAAEEGYDTFYTGMARGVDLWAGQAVICGPKAQSEAISLIAAVPFETQVRGFYPDEQAVWHRLIRAVDEIWLTNSNTLVDLDEMLQLAASMPNPEHYAVVNWLLGRNKWMIDRSDAVLAIWDGVQGMGGGTANAVAHAVKIGKPVYHFNPFEGRMPTGIMDLRKI